MIARLVLVVWLTCVWVALWGDPSAATAAAGAFIGTVLVVLFPVERQLAPVIRPVALTRLVVVFVWRLVAASAVVAWEVITPRNRINEGIVAVPVLGASDLVVTIVANAVSLTPGTLTLEVDRTGSTLYIHVLHLHDIESVRRDVQKFEELLIRAVGNADAIAALTDSTSTSHTRGG